MADFIEVSRTSELQDGTMKEVSVQGRKMLLARIGDKYYATDNRCPHLGAKLSQGKLEGTTVICPRHGSQFDLSDGRVLRWTNWSGLISKLSQVLKSPRPLTLYKTRVEDDKILIEL